MNFKNLPHTKRRGLSSIVGALLFVVLMVAAFAVIGVALDSQTDIAATGRDVAAKDLEKQQEDFVVTSILQPPAEDLEVNLINQGQNPTEIFTIVITEVDNVAGGLPATTYEIPSSTSFLTPGDTDSTDIVSTTPIFLPLAAPASPDLEYEIKVISSLGTIKTQSIFCDEFSCGPPPGAPAGASSIDAQLFLDGPNAVNSKTSTIVFFVTNNGAQTLTNVTPLFGLGPDCDDMWQGNFIPPPPEITDVTPCVLDSPNPVTLVPGQSALFKWDGVVFGDVGDRAVFCNQASGIDEDTLVVTTGTECDDLNVINPNDCGGANCPSGGEGGATIILIDDLLTRPSLFMVIPSPFGDDADGSGAVWGVNLVNPTEVDMTVSKVTIVVYPPTANDADSILVKDGGMSTCVITAINPTSNWSCPKDNTILWQTNDPLEYINLPARTAVEVLVSVEPGSPSANTDIDALIVQANVFTTLGSFGKGEGYQSTMRSGDISIVNVFLQTTDTIVPIVTTNPDRTDFHGVNNFPITEFIKEDFFVSLADMDDDEDTYIEAGARFIVNVPRDWTEVCIISAIGFEADMDGDPTPCVDERVVEVGDGSTQITLFTEFDIGGHTGVEEDVRTVHFEARPPCNDIDGVDQPYIMYVLADGVSKLHDTDPSKIKTFPIGPLNEVALVVDYDPGLDRTTCVPPQ